MNIDLIANIMVIAMVVFIGFWLVWLIGMMMKSPVTSARKPMGERNDWNDRTELNETNERIDRTDLELNEMKGPTGRSGQTELNQFRSRTGTTELNEMEGRTGPTELNEMRWRNGLNGKAGITKKVKVQIMNKRSMKICPWPPGPWADCCLPIRQPHIRLRAKPLLGLGSLIPPAGNCSALATQGSI